MKQKNLFTLMASVMMLAAMTLASCKSSNKPADAAALFGPESYHLHDYGFFYNNLKQNIADRIKAFLETAKK